ncbi:MAG: hypothetical protein Q9195_006594 [Heterodermia aff. obscurata]
MLSIFGLISFSLCLLANLVNPSLQATAPIYAPIPAAAEGPPVSNITGFRVQAFGHGAYMITDGNYQSFFLVACDSVIVVDAPPSIGHKLLKGIRTVTNLPISHVVYSHAHADHIGAAYLLTEPNVTFIAQEETLKELRQGKDPNRPFPNVVFSHYHRLHVCNQTLDLSYKGPNHQPGNIFIYAPLQKLVMLVDIVFPGWVPFDALAESQNIPGFIKAHDQILEYDFRYYIGGHLTRVGTRQDVVNQRAYMMDLYNNCAEAIRLSGSPPNASNPLSVQTSLAAVQAADPGNSWATFEVYIYDVVGAWCANKTNAVWLGKLAGADVYGQSNAVTMMKSLRIDFGILGPYGVTDS